MNYILCSIQQKKRDLYHRLFRNCGGSNIHLSITDFDGRAQKNRTKGLEPHHSGVLGRPLRIDTYANAGCHCRGGRTHKVLIQDFCLLFTRLVIK